MRYQEIYPSEPLLDSTAIARPSATDLLTLEYFEAPPGEMATEVFNQHHILLNLQEYPHEVENWRDGEHKRFVFEKDQIVVTPAGISSGWRWHKTSKVIVITLDPEKFERFAQSEAGIILTGSQLQNLPLFTDPDLCSAGVMLLDALTSQSVGADLLFESLARVFLIKLIQKYGDLPAEDFAFSSSFTSKHYQQVLQYIQENYQQNITAEELAEVAAMSVAHFSRLFKKVTTQSPIAFVMAYRIEQAKKKLSNADMPLIDIALECGFADQSHFNRVFKKHEGVTPRVYRNSF